MPQEHLLQVSPEIGKRKHVVKSTLKTTKDCSKEINMLLLKRSIDASSKAIKINQSGGLFLKENFKERKHRTTYQNAKC
jgi:hypothetical protein